MVSSSGLRIVVLGYIVRGPLGGICWSDLHYLLGLRAFGHDVYFVEDSGDSPWCCYDPTRHVTTADPSYGLQYARTAFEAMDLGERWCYFDAHTQRWLGPCANGILDVCATADLLLNLGGVNPVRPWLSDIPTRALVDKDPVFTQIRHLTDPLARQMALMHTVFFSFAGTTEAGRCSVPNDGFPWQPTCHPIFLDAWPVTPSRPQANVTTVMQWESYPALEHGGVRYGMKSESFEPYYTLPKTVGARFELALGGSSAPREQLRAQGWILRDPLEVAGDPWSYRQYIQQSRAEWSVAKHGYIVSRCGWFSERSAAYLASGRPVLLEDTGFSEWLPTGSGVLAFSSLEDVQAGVDSLNARYASHCDAARAVAEQHFDAQKVLVHLVEAAWSAPRRSVRGAPAPEGAS